MSRSYRKNLILTDNSSNHRYKPSRKQVASRITRAKLKHNPDLTTVYKKVYDSYDIVDFKTRYDPAFEYISQPYYKWHSK
jgi:hypothetical protein